MACPAVRCWIKKDLQPICFENGTWGEGDSYQGEIMFVIDDKHKGYVRVIGSSCSPEEAFEHNIIFDCVGKMIAEG